MSVKTTFEIFLISLLDNGQIYFDAFQSGLTKLNKPFVYIVAIGYTRTSSETDTHLFTNTET